MTKINQNRQKSIENQPKSILNNSWLTKIVQNWFWTVWINFQGCNSKEKQCEKIVQNCRKSTKIDKNCQKLTKIDKNQPKLTKINQNQFCAKNIAKIDCKHQYLMASQTSPYLPKQIWGKKRLFKTSSKISKNAQFSSWSWFFYDFFKMKRRFLFKTFVHNLECQKS